MIKAVLCDSGSNFIDNEVQIRQIPPRRKFSGGSAIKLCASERTVQAGNELKN